MKLFFAFLLIGTCGCSHMDSNGCIHIGKIRYHDNRPWDYWQIEHGGIVDWHSRPISDIPPQYRNPALQTGSPDPNRH